MTSIIEDLHRNDDAFCQLELDKQFIGCDIDDLMAAINVNTTVCDVAIHNSFLRILNQHAARTLLVESIAKLPNLNKLYIRGFSFPMKELCYFLSKVMSLNWLLLSDLVLAESEDIFFLAEALNNHHATLRHFSLFRLDLMNADLALDSIVKSLSSCKSLEWVWIDMKSRQQALKDDSLALLCQCKDLRELTLKRLALNEKQTVSFAVALEANDTMNRLRLWDCINLNERQGIAIAKLLQLNRALEELSMTHVEELDTKAGIAITMAMQNNSTMKEFVLTIKYHPETCCSNFANSLSEMLRTNDSLESLALLHDGLDDEGFIAIANALEMNNSLKKLVLRNPRKLGQNGKITNRGYEAMVRMLHNNCSLETITTDVEGELKSKMEFYLAMDRKLLMKTNISKSEWVQALVNQRKHLAGFYYLISSNPSFCQNTN